KLILVHVRIMLCIRFLALCFSSNLVFHFLEGYCGTSAKSLNSFFISCRPRLFGLDRFVGTDLLGSDHLLFLHLYIGHHYLFFFASGEFKLSENLLLLFRCFYHNLVQVRVHFVLHLGGRHFLHCNFHLGFRQRHWLHWSEGTVRKGGKLLLHFERLRLNIVV